MSALFGGLNDRAIAELPLSDIKADPKQPRKFFDEAKLKELADSIGQHGLKQPILVRPDPDGGYLITAGERRYRAHQLLKRETIPAIISEETDAAIVSIIENLQREDLTAIEEAEAVASLIQERGISQGDAGKLLGKDRTAINQLLMINKLPAQIRADASDVQVGKFVLAELARLDDEALQLRLWKKAKDGNLRRDDIRAAASEKKGKSKKDEGVSPLTPAGKTLAAVAKATTTLQRQELSDDDRAYLQSLIQSLTAVLEGRQPDTEPVIE